MISELSPDDEELLVEFLLDWEDSLRTPAPKTPEQICIQRTDLVGELKRRIASLKRVNRMIFESAPTTGANDTGSNRLASASTCPELPGYQITAVIGQGGMGIVYQAIQERLNRFVAIKTIRGGRWVSPQNVARFKGEAEILARLRHPGIVQIHDVLEHDGMLCLVLEFVNLTSPVGLKNTMTF